MIKKINENKNQKINESFTGISNFGQANKNMSSKMTWTGEVFKFFQGIFKTNFPTNP